MATRSRRPSPPAPDARERLALRRAAVPALNYPPELPVSACRDELLEAIGGHQVVVVAGATGSGKTTQLPKLCLELGRGIEGTIAHTQPRRLAARTVAQRIADELGVELGGTVGYAVRFTDRSRDDTLVRLMTDGLLLAEIRRDRLLRRYDTVIVDEAHERSLNVDFLLGYLKRILPRRPDLKLIITSATIDPQRFSAHFGDAPVVEVSGRTYPVEVRHRPLADPDDEGAGADRDPAEAIGDAIDELVAEGPGDVLVFLSGEREIRETADGLRGRFPTALEVLPLYARLSAAEQQRAFRRHAGRRVVLATNVAETSLTVPGIRYVVDPGTARISRYSARLKVQRLPIEPISQASADQRKGRCGRTSDGICIRLYTEEDFAGRPRFTDPEILRTNLASVILQMAAAGLGEIKDFPFLDPPDPRQVRDGLALLHELGALEGSGGEAGQRLTQVGRRLAREARSRLRSTPTERCSSAFRQAPRMRSSARSTHLFGAIARSSSNAALARSVSVTKCRLCLVGTRRVLYRCCTRSHEHHPLASHTITRTPYPSGAVGRTRSLLDAFERFAREREAPSVDVGCLSATTLVAAHSSIAAGTRSVWTLPGSSATLMAGTPEVRYRRLLEGT